MAYTERYRFTFASNNGKDLRVSILDNAYTGDVLYRSLGSAPVFKVEQSDCVRGSSLTLEAECLIEDEFADLYTPDPCRFRVDVYQGQTLFWQGFITPELYSAPWIDPPYNVQITATDGLGELKRYDFEPMGRVSLSDILSTLLSKTGFSYNIDLISQMTAGSSTRATMLDTLLVNIDHMEGKNCYEALQALLTSLHATIMQKGGKWLLIRETDVADSISSNAVVSVGGTSHSIVGFGSMASTNVWPVGQLSMEIEPARRSLSVNAENHYAESLMPSISEGSWQGTGVYGSGDGGYYSLAANQYIQASAVLGTSDRDLNLVLKIKMRSSASSAQNVSVMVTAKGPNASGTQKTFYLKGGTTSTLWATTSGSCTIEVPAADDGSVEDAKEYTLILPFAYPGGRSANIPAVSLSSLIVKITAASNNIFVYSADISAQAKYSALKTSLAISNGARGEGEEYEPALADTIASNSGRGYIDNCPKDATEFSSSIVGACTFSEFLAKDCALSVALPRLRLKGKLNVHTELLPLFLRTGGLNYIMEELSWDMLNDEMEVSILSLPAASISVASIKVVDQDGKTLSSTYVTPSFFSVPATDTQSHTINIGVPAGQAWTITNIPSWANFSKTSGTGPDTVTFRCTSNNTTRNRNQAVSIYGTAVTISQAAAAESIRLGSDTINLDNTQGATANVSVTTNADWTLSGLPSWLRASYTSGSGSKTVTFTTLESNSDSSSRSVTLTFTTTKGASVSLTATQAAGSSAVGTAYFNVETASILGGQGSWATIGVTKNKIASQSFFTSEPWLTYSSNADGSLITVTASQANTTGSSRTATLTGTWVDTNGFTITDSVTISQASVSVGSASFDVGEAAIDQAEGSSFQLQYTESNIASRSFSASASWLTISQISDGVLLVVANSANNTGSMRSATITGTWVGEDGSTYTDTCGVSQSDVIEPVIEASFNSHSASLECESGKSTTIGYTADGSLLFFVSSDADWLSVSDRGQRSEIVITTLSQNNTGQARTATITGEWDDVDGTAVYDTITVSQAAAVQIGNAYFRPTSVDMESDAGSTTVAVTESNIASRQFTSDSAWLTYSYSNGVLTLNATRNTGAAGRQGTIDATWTDTRGFVITGKVTVNQPAYTQVGSASFNPSSINLTGYAGSVDVNVVESNIASRQFTSDSDWLTFSYSNGVLTVTTTLNASSVTRQGTISAVWTDTRGFTIEGTLTVSQAAAAQVGDAAFIDDILSLYDGNSGRWVWAQISKLDIESQSFVSDVDWLSITDHDSYIEIAATASNTTGVGRIGTITGTFVDSAGFPITSSVMVTQPSLT